MSFFRPRFIIFCIVIILGGLFAFRIFQYYQKILDGTLTLEEIPNVSFQNRMTTSAITKAVTSKIQTEDVFSEDDPSLGNSNAPLIIVEFADFACEYSKEVSHTIRYLATKFPEVIYYVYRDFPVVDIHPDATLAHEASECAHSQDIFWQYHDKLYANQEDFSKEALVRYAQEVGLDTTKFESCLSQNRYAPEVAKDLADGLAAGVYGTPTFFLNGVRVEGAIPEDIFTSIVEAFKPS